MPTKNHVFPWGVYIGDLIEDSDTIPLYLDSKQGGFCVLFDESSEKIANNFIENIALKLFEVLPIGDIVVDVFDFGKKRFMYLSSLKNAKLYDIAYSHNSSSSKFNTIEEVALYRHHNLLSFDAPTLSEYNQQHSIREKYHLLLVNLDNFPDDMTSEKRIKNFFDSAYDAGFYTIAFGNKEVLGSDSKSTQSILNKFSHLNIENKKITLTKGLFEFADMLEDYEFEYINNNKDSIIKNLLSQLKKKDEGSSEQDFLSIPIGTSTDGRDEISFTLGDRSNNYHAFITGVSGSGKTTLLNNVIVGIAERYTSDDIRLYLMDYKEGVEFQVFKHHPNCEKIFLDNEDLQASIDLLEEFTQTIKNRAEVFRYKQIKDITTYNSLYPQSKMHRIILVIDEVHRLFLGNYKQKEYFSNLLKQVVRQGRSFGVHIILSTQTLSGANIDRELMSQITLRISYKLTNHSDSEAIFTYGNIEALNLGKYEFIYNTNAGNKSSNLLCKAHSPKDINATLAKVHNDREQHHILTPEIVQSHEVEIESDRSEQEGLKVDRYSSKAENELLARLDKMGIKAKSGDIR